MRRIPSLLCWALALVLLASCAPTEETRFFEGVSIRAYEKANQASFEATGRWDFEHILLLQPDLALFVNLNDDNAPLAVMDQLSQLVQQQVQQTGFFSRVLPSPEVENLLKENKELKGLKELYLESLNGVAISDKEISNPMGKLLKTGSFLSFQLDLWPCSDCPLPNLMRVKLRLVDAETGLIVWTGIAERDILEPSQPEVAQKIKEITQELMEGFHHRFKRKWHKLRFQHLAGKA